VRCWRVGLSWRVYSMRLMRLVGRSLPTSCSRQVWLEKYFEVMNIYLLHRINVGNFVAGCFMLLFDDRPTDLPLRHKTAPVFLRSQQHNPHHPIQHPCRLSLLGQLLLQHLQQKIQKLKLLSLPLGHQALQ
jgi:hypothetical protein